MDEYTEGEKLRLLPCGHGEYYLHVSQSRINLNFASLTVYHLKCIDPWLTKNRRVCPVCKAKVILPGMEDISDTDGENENVTSTSERTPLLPDQPRNHRRTRRAPRRSRRRASTIDSVGTATSLAPSSSSQSDQQQPTSTSALAPVAASVVAAVRSVFTSNSESRHRIVSVDVNESLPSPSGQYSVNCDDDNHSDHDPNRTPESDVSALVTSSDVQVELNLTAVEESSNQEPRQQRRTPRRRNDNIV